MRDKRQTETEEERKTRNAKRREAYKHKTALQTAANQ
jgi:hypothetical protein